jgi:hypothetical protein
MTKFVLLISTAEAREFVKRARRAMDVEDGSNDAEHEMLEEIVEDIERALGDRNDYA